VLKDPVPRLAGVAAPHVEVELQRILDKCLERDLTLRYQAARDLVVDLRATRRRLDAPLDGSAVTAAGAVLDLRLSTALRVVIVDDEDPARAVLREYLEREAQIEIVAECRNGFEAVKAVAEARPDLVFLDIQMPKLDGFEVLELIGGDVAVVFVTAFDEHAVRAFEVNAVDYLLKPVAPERIASALARVRQRLAARLPVTPPVSQLLSAVRLERAHAERILVRDGARVDVIPVDTLDYAQAQDDYVALKTAGREHLKQQTLTELEKTLDPQRFVRIHRSYLLNVDRLAKLETDSRENRIAVLRDGTRLPVSRAGFGRLRGLL
jgi:two-component system LytT family response regulator